MRTKRKHSRLPVLFAGLAVAAPLALAGSAAAVSAAPATSAASYAAPINGTIRGFSSGDFTFLDALSVKSLNLTQASIAQSAAGVSNKTMQTTDTLGQDLFTSKNINGHNAYGRGAGVSLNLGQKDNSVPQAQLTQAEAASPPVNSSTTKQLLNLPLAPVANVDIQPDTAQANTTSDDNFCVLGAPLSEGTATVANADVVPVTGGISLASANGTVRNDSTEELDPNGQGSLGLTSVTTLNTAGITLFKGVPGAEINIKIVNPLVLKAFAGGVKGTSKVTFGSPDGQKDLLSVEAGGQKVVLTVEQLLGGKGATIPIVGSVNNKVLHLLNIEVGGEPRINMSTDGTMASAVADLVKVQVINKFGKTKTSIGGPLGPILNPILGPAVDTLDQLVGQLQPVIESLGLDKGVDLRIGHFEANAQVPQGGIDCGLPVKKSVDKDPVTPGDKFTVTITADNPYDCVVKDVRVDDHINATPGVKWTVGDTRPPADKTTNDEVVWNDIGNIAPGDSKSVEVDISIDADSAAGKMNDTAHVSGTCGTGDATGTDNVNLTGEYTLNAPQITAGSSPRLPDTGMSPLVPIGGGLLLAAGIGVAVLRRRISD